MDSSLCSAKDDAQKDTTMSPEMITSVKATVVHAESFSADTHMLEQEHDGMSGSTVDGATLVQAVCAEPIRRMSPGDAQKPKRFFRTFWRGLSGRLLAHDNQIVIADTSSE